MKLEKIIAIGLCTGSILCHTNSYPDETKTLEQVEQELKENEKKIEENEKLINSYTTLEKNIQSYANKKEYSKIQPLIDSIENELKENPLPIAKKILEELKNISYFEYRKIPEVIERVKVSDPIYKKKWIPPTNRPVFSNPVGPVFGGGKSSRELQEEYRRNRENQLSQYGGHYEEECIRDAVYENRVVSPAYFQKYQVFPYTKKEKIVEDKIPNEKIIKIAENPLQEVINRLIKKS